LVNAVNPLAANPSLNIRLVFVDTLGNIDLPTIGATITGGGAVTPTPALDGFGNGLQTLTLTGTPGGSFFPSYNSFNSGTLPYSNGTSPPASAKSPTAAEVKAALTPPQATSPLFDLASGLPNIDVFGAPGGPFSIVFVNKLAQTDVSNIVPTVRGSEKQRLVISQASGGTFKVVFNGNLRSPDITFPVTFNFSQADQDALAADIQAKLNDA